MEINKALTQIAEIHRHLAKSEVYRGYRTLPVALTGVFALLGGALQTWIFPAHSPADFVQFWVIIAFACILPVASEVTFDYIQRTSPVSRRMTRKVVGQFLPALTAGAGVTFIVTFYLESFIPILPGLWALFFSVGIFSSRPYLPRAIGWVGLFYLAGGMILLLASSHGKSLTPWGMAALYGIGQLLAATALYRNLERNDA